MFAFETTCLWNQLRLKGKRHCDSLRRQFAEAYCIRAICTQEENPKSMVLITCIFIHLSLCHNISPIVPITCIFYLIFYLLWCNQCIIEDIRKALSFWSEMHTLSQKDLKLLYYAYDLLSVKVCSFGPYLLF